MAIQSAIKKLFVLMLENRSYDNLLGWSDLRGWQPDGSATQADGLLGKPLYTNADCAGKPHPVGQGAPFRLAFDPGHEFSDVLLQLCGRDAPGITGSFRSDSILLPADGSYPPIAAQPNDLGFACCLDQYGFDTSSGLRCFAPDQLPVINFLAHQFAVCDRWFSSVPGPTWPNRFFALAGTSWGLDSSPSDSQVIESNLFDGEKFGSGSDSLLTRLEPDEWLVAQGDTPQAKAVKGTDKDGRAARFMQMDAFLEALAQNGLDESVKFVFIEPRYDPILKFRNGNSMHPTGDVRRGEALVRDIYEALKDSSYWNECALLITFDEHGGFFDHVIPDPRNIGVANPAPAQPTILTKHNFRFDRYGFRVPTLIVSPFVREATIDHTFHDHLSIAKTLAEIARPGSDEPLLGGDRFKNATSFSSVFMLDKPRDPGDIPACPPPLPVPDRTIPLQRDATAKAFMAIR